MAEEEGGGGWRGMVRPNNRTPPHKERRLAKRQWSVERRQGRLGRKRSKKEEMENEIPHGGERERLSAWGGLCPPQSKTRIYLTSHWNVCTCCCRNCMETSPTTMMHHTCMGESRTTLYGSVIGAG